MHPSTPAVVVNAEQVVNAPLDSVMVAPDTVKSSLIVTALSVSEIAPDNDSVVTPLTAPAVSTSNALELILKLSPLSPRVTTPFAVRVPFEVSPLVAVIRPEIVGVAVLSMQLNQM